jgi:hypothetical protein
MYAYPNRQDLITCFLKTNYAGHTAIVFCDVLGDCNRPARLQKLFDLADMASIINSEVFIVTGQTAQFFLFDNQRRDLRICYVLGRHENRL